MRVTVDVPDSIWFRIEDEANHNGVDARLFFMIGGVRASLAPRRGPATDLLTDLEIIRLHSQKLLTSDIAILLRRDRQFVSRRLRIYGLASNANNAYSPARLEVIRLHKLNRPVTEICKEVGVPRRLVDEWLRVYKSKVRATVAANEAQRAKRMARKAAAG